MLRGCEPEVLENFQAALSTLEELGCTVVESEPLAGFDMNDYAAVRNLSGIEKAAYIKDMLLQRPVSTGGYCLTHTPRATATTAAAERQRACSCQLFNVNVMSCHDRSQGDVSPECSERSIPLLDTKAEVYITALEARAEIERRMQNGLAEYAHGFYAIPPMKIVAPLVPKDLAEQDAIRLSGAAAVSVSRPILIAKLGRSVSLCVCARARVLACTLCLPFPSSQALTGYHYHANVRHWLACTHASLSLAATRRTTPTRGCSTRAISPRSQSRPA